jgi:hypothetical protein
MNEEEKKAIEIVEDIAFSRGIRQDVNGKLEDLKAIKDVFRLVDNKQKEIEELIERLSIRKEQQEIGDTELYKLICEMEEDDE